LRKELKLNQEESKQLSDAIRAFVETKLPMSALFEDVIEAKTEIIIE